MGTKAVQIEPLLPLFQKQAAGDAVELTQPGRRCGTCAVVVHHPAAGGGDACHGGQGPGLRPRPAGPAHSHLSGFLRQGAAQVQNQLRSQIAANETADHPVIVKNQAARPRSTDQRGS